MVGTSEEGFKVIRKAFHRTFIVVMAMLLVAPVSQAAGAPPSTPSSARIAPTQTVSAEDAHRRVPKGNAQATGHNAVAYNRPTISPSDYARLKAQAAASSEVPSIKSGPLRKAPPTWTYVNAAGVDQVTACGTCRPPDTDGAVGFAHFVEVTNFHYDVYTKAAPPVNVKSVSLASFFGYTTQPLFDPQVKYDVFWNRWIVTAEAFAESPTIQRYFVAISTSGNPTGSFYIYNFNVNFTGTDFYDYPHVGYDQDAVIFTANVFDSNTNAFKYAETYGVAKAALYRGASFSVPVFTNLVGTLAAPIVQDNSGKAYLMAAPPSGTTFSIYEATGFGRTTAALAGPFAVTVPAYTVPPNAPQPGVTSKLDTSDSRFINQSSQIGDSLFQVHTIALGSFAAPRWYEINAATRTVIQSGTFFATGSSFDFNASIAANPSKDVYVNWSMTDTAVNPQVRFSGRTAADPAGVIPGGVALFTSPAALHTSDEPERWGDYSAVTLDPTYYGSCPGQQKIAWLVNENVLTSTTWGTRIGRIGFC